MGLQAKDWEIRCVEAGGYYGGWRGVTGVTSTLDGWTVEVARASVTGM